MAPYHPKPTKKEGGGGLVHPQVIHTRSAKLATPPKTDYSSIVTLHTALLPWLVLILHQFTCFYSFLAPPTPPYLFTLHPYSPLFHTSNACKATYVHIRHISSEHIFTTQATQTLVCSLVLSPVMLYFQAALSTYLDKLQKVQNAAAKLRNLTTFILFLQICFGYQSHIASSTNISTIHFNSTSGTSPQYLSNPPFNHTLQQDNYDLHLTPTPLWPLV